MISDTGKIYVNMCAKAEEIQDHFSKNQWENIPSCIFDSQITPAMPCIWFSMSNEWWKRFSSAMAELDHEEVFVMPIERRNKPENMEVEDGYIWLPSVSQLQKLIDIEDPRAVSKEMYEFCLLHSQYSEKFQSLEQLWLAFVMYKLYGKVWEHRSWKPFEKKKHD